MASAAPSAPLPRGMFPSCPCCGSSHRQTKHGKTAFGSQKFRCHACQKNYVPQPKRRGHPASTRELALKMYVDGLGFRRIGRLLNVNPQSVANWIAAHHTALPPVPAVLPSETADVIEMDELFTFVGEKKDGSTS